MIIEWKFVVSCFFFSKFWSSKHSCYALCSCSVSFLHIPCLVYRYVSRFYLFQFYKRNRSGVPRVFFYHTKTCYITVVQWKMFNPVRNQQCTYYYQKKSMTIFKNYKCVMILKNLVPTIHPATTRMLRSNYAFLTIFAMVTANGRAFA